MGWKKTHLTSHTSVAEMQVPPQTLLMYIDQTLPVLLGSQLQMTNFEAPGRIYAEFIF